MNDPDGWRDIDKTQREEIARLRADAEYSFKRITELEAALRDASDRIRQLAFEMPAPNEWTPQFVMVALEMARIGRCRAFPKDESR